MELMGCKEDEGPYTLFLVLYLCNLTARKLWLQLPQFKISLSCKNEWIRKLYFYQMNHFVWNLMTQLLYITIILKQIKVCRKQVKVRPGNAEVMVSKLSSKSLRKYFFVQKISPPPRTHFLLSTLVSITIN